MKYAVVGSRSGISSDFVFETLRDLNLNSLTDQIVSGGAKGVDNYAEVFAKIYNIECIVYKPEYDLYGRAAPIVRNKHIVDVSDTVLVFTTNPPSKGSRSVIDYAIKVFKPLHVFHPSY
ncbi:MAG: DUF2493 domain-containing protein [Bacteroidales bacterium]|jgi:hypothetical protein|nr:DUF2493 domain-containing protein [Bacteroidales bacterium]